MANEPIILAEDSILENMHVHMLSCTFSCRNHVPLGFRR